MNSRNRNRRARGLLALSAAALLAMAGTASADVLLIQRVEAKSQVALPERGLSMAQVEQRFGAPSERLDPRGGQKGQWPTINRWVYPQFTVYFERDRVINVVLNQAASNEVGPKPAIRCSPANGQALFPAEGEPQSAALLAGPHAGTDWAGRLGEVEESYIALVAAITRFQPAVVCVADADVEAYARARLASARVDMARVRFVEVEYDDTWLRDTGPITLREGSGFRMLDFRFTGWGGKFDAGRDDRLAGRLHEAGIFLNSSLQNIDFALEGGAIETDGEGTLLSTLHCLRERHPDISREELEARLGAWLHQDRFLWLRRGY